MAVLLRFVLQFLFGAFTFALPEILKRVLTFLGIGALTLTGLNYVESQLIQMFTAQLNGLPGTVIKIVGMLRIDDAFSLMISAFVLRQYFDGWTNGSKSIFTRNTTGTSSDPWSAPRTGGWF
jgi:hypothetical protein